ncbi:MAG: hypothetical protein C5B54_05870, partial [Acidobacteria bacterium]
ERKQSNEALERLVSGVAHEVRSPLFAISTSTQTLAKKIKEMPEFNPYIDMILSQVKRLSNLMMDLLEVKRPAQALLKTPQNIFDLLESTKSNLVAANPHAEEAVLLPDQTENILVTVNREKIIQAFFNLLQNAIQHSPSSARAVQVIVVPNGSEVTIKITDTGSGIPPEHLSHVFQPFFTLRKDGIGLGLSIAKTILDAHGGKVRVYNNEPPPGCTFEITLSAQGENHA